MNWLQLPIPPPQSASVLQSGRLEQPQRQKPWNFREETPLKVIHSGSAGAAGASPANGLARSSWQGGAARAAGGAVTVAWPEGASPATAGRAAKRARARIESRVLRMRFSF